MSKLSILDCTLRDGGYINHWNFGKETIKGIVNKLHDADIDIIECGFCVMFRMMKMLRYFPV